MRRGAVEANKAAVKCVCIVAADADGKLLKMRDAWIIHNSGGARSRMMMPAFFRSIALFVAGAGSAVMGVICRFDPPACEKRGLASLSRCGALKTRVPSQSLFTICTVFWNVNARKPLTHCNTRCDLWKNHNLCSAVFKTWWDFLLVLYYKFIAEFSVQGFLESVKIWQSYAHGIERVIIIFA